MCSGRSCSCGAPLWPSVSMNARRTTSCTSDCSRNRTSAFVGCTLTSSASGGISTIAHAIIDSYSQASIKERSPEVHLFIEMPPDALDVNVHPTKAEVRFREQSLVHEVVRRAFMETLGQSGAPQLQLRPEHMAQAQERTITLPGVLAGGTYPSRWMPHEGKEPPRPQSPQSVQSTESQAFSAPSAVSAVPSSSPVDLKPMIPLGQFRDTFIIAVDDEGVAIIDQHVAHERVLFERVMERLTSGRLESQQLLIPMVMEMTPSAQQALVNRTAELERLGFEVE